MALPAESPLPLPSRQCNFAAFVEDSALRHADDLAFVWLDDHGHEAISWTYSDFWARVVATAHKLRRKLGAVQGQHVLLVYEQAPEFPVGFMGCLLAGCVAVPVYPPLPADLERGLAKLANVAELTEVRLVLTSAKYNALRRVLALKAKMSKSRSQAWPPGLKWVCTDTLKPRRTPFEPAAVAPSDVAFVQFTSGSTGDPKGVSITHNNIVANERFIRDAIGSRPGDARP